MRERSASHTENSRSREEQREVHAADFDPHVQKAVEIMEDHASELESDNTFDEIIERYGRVAEELKGNPNFFKRKKLEKERGILARTIQGNHAFDKQIDRELQEATQREAVLSEEEHRELRYHLDWELEYGHREFPENIKTEESGRFFQMWRLMRMCSVCLCRCVSAENGMTIESSRQFSGQYSPLWRRYTSIEKMLETMQDHRKHPERYSLETWDGLIEQARDLFEELLMLSREKETVAKMNGFVPFRERPNTTGLS